MSGSSRQKQDEGTAWGERELADPHGAADKAERVQRMFAAIAESYDLNNRVHSMGRDQAWRRKAVALCDVQPGEKVLDVACGTGDLSLAFAEALRRKGGADETGPGGDGSASGGGGGGGVMGMDFTFEMLPIAREKARRAEQAVTFAAADAMRLPLADASVDVVSIAFGIRNVADHAAAMREFRRVLRPGGRLCVLEFSLPRNAVLRGLYNFYFRHVMPRTATLISGDRSGAYRYLPQSVNTFIDREAMVTAMHQAGFSGVTQHPMTFGIAIGYVGNC